MIVVLPAPSSPRNKTCVVVWTFPIAIIGLKLFYCCCLDVDYYTRLLFVFFFVLWFGAKARNWNRCVALFVGWEESPQPSTLGLRILSLLWPIFSDVWWAAKSFSLYPNVSDSFTTDSGTGILNRSGEKKIPTKTRKLCSVVPMIECSPVYFRSRFSCSFSESTRRELLPQSKQKNNQTTSTPGPLHLSPPLLT